VWSHVASYASHLTPHTPYPFLTLVRSQSFALYSGGRDKAVHEWQGSAWHSSTADGLAFAGNILPPSCGDVVLALAASSSSSSSSSTVVAGSKNGCIQTWRAGKAEGSTSLQRGAVNAVQVRQRTRWQPLALTRGSWWAAATCWRGVRMDASSRCVMCDV
jgi:hypothetical protein